jgi:hypothetical protein
MAALLQSFDGAALKRAPFLLVGKPPYDAVSFSAARSSS